MSTNVHKRVDFIYKDDASLTPLDPGSNLEEKNANLFHPNENHKDDPDCNFHSGILKNGNSCFNYGDKSIGIQPINNNIGEELYRNTHRDGEKTKRITKISTKRPERRQAIDILQAKEQKAERKKLVKSSTKLPQEIEDEQNTPPRLLQCKNIMQRYLNHNVELGIMTVLTIFALFGSDLKSIALDKNYDGEFQAIILVVMALFFFELFGSIWVQPGYLWSFFFWLDLFAAGSMILEVEYILIPIIEGIMRLGLGSADQKELLLRSTMTHKISMTIRVLRIIRLIRIVKLYKMAIVFLKIREFKKRLEELKIKKLERLEKEIKLLKKKEDDRLQKMNSKLPPLRLTTSVVKKIKTIKPDKSLSKENFCELKSNLGIGMKSDMNENALVNVNAIADNEKSPSLHNNYGSYFTLNIENTKKGAQNKLNALVALHNIQQEEQEEVEHQEESRISKVVSESITQKVIIMILLLLFLSPLTDDDVYSSDSNVSYLILCNFLNNVFAVYNCLPLEMNQTIQQFIFNHSDPNFPIISIENNNYDIFRNYSLNQSSDYYRLDEIAFAFSPEGNTLITYSNKINTFLSALLNVARTIFACIVLFSMAYFLGKDSKSMILNPLEVMINVVDTVAMDPVNYKTIEDLKKNIQNSIEHIHKKNKIGNDYELSVDYEIKIIQFAIIRISALMAIGFGEAGGEILKENIGSYQGLNPMLPGKKIKAIFGFCYILHFSEINEVLQEKTMVFVNQVADIVHSSVDKFGGSANKNIGESFLLVWKLPTGEENDGGQNLDKKNSNYVADQALLAFLNIIKKINKSPPILAYRNDPQLKEKRGSKFKVQMGFGLHVGWAIEGAIGSFYKIDCSYLSPNVNIAARLEMATNMYGVDILISGELYQLLSEYMQRQCRMIDVVTLKGCVTPVQLFTVDCNTNLKPGNSKKKKMTARERRKYYASKKAKLKAELETQQDFLTIGEIYYHKSKGIRNLLRKIKPASFLECFESGLKCYINGQWEEAYQNFKHALYIDKTDGPSKTLFRYIKANNRKAPTEWKGYRKLDAKS